MTDPDILETHENLPLIREVFDKLSHSSKQNVLATLLIFLFDDFQYDEEDIRVFINGTLHGLAMLNRKEPLKIMFFNEKGEIL